MNRLTVMSRSALVPDGCLHARIALRAARHRAAAGFVRVGQRTQALGREHAVEAFAGVEQPPGARVHVPREVRGHGICRHIGDLVAGEPSGGDAEIPQDRVQLADSAVRAGPVQGPRPGVGGDVGSVGHDPCGYGWVPRLR